MDRLKQLLIALLFATAVTAGAALAQPAEAPDPNSPLSESAAEAPVEPTADESSIDAQAGQAFEDYEASEQISEDLSVAFPVDI